MNKFYEWMEEKNYGKLGGQNEFILYQYTHLFEEILHPTKQMLIGYMIEYLLKNKKTHKNTIYVIAGKNNINNVYKQLKIEIESII